MSVAKKLATDEDVLKTPSHKVAEIIRGTLSLMQQPGANTKPPRPPRIDGGWCANAILASVVAFIALVAVSMTSYPGGSWLDRRAQGHDLLRNFLCDLLGPVAINGQPNGVGSTSMIAAMVVLALGLGVTWWSLPGLFAGKSLALAIRASGTLSLLGLVAVPLTPPTVSYQLHAAAIFAGGIPAAAAWVLSLYGLSRGAPTRRLALLGGVALALILLGFALYARQYWGDGAPTVLLPASHRVATASFLAWLIAAALQLRAAGE